MEGWAKECYDICDEAIESSISPHRRSNQKLNNVEWAETCETESGVEDSL